MRGAVLVVYQALLGLVACVAIPYLFFMRRAELRERLGGGGPGRAQAGGAIWIHAASLGEFEAAWPLVRAFRESGHPIVVSCTNHVARSRIAERLPAGARCRLAPIDLWPCLVWAFRAERPSCFVIIETEIWPAWILVASRLGIPIALASARISARSFPRYRRLRPFLSHVLGEIRVIGCRGEEDRERWVALGARPDACVVWGNTKYEAGGAPEPAIPLRGGDRFVLVAGSVRRGEEGVLDVVSAVGPERLRLVVVPRHVRETAAWEEACVRRRLACRRLSLTGLIIEEAPADVARALRSPRDGLPEVVIADRIGALGALYRAADAAFVGGTWVPLGGHNLFEPAREGRPVYFGPSIGGVRDVAESLAAESGGACVAGPDELTAAIRQLIDDPDLRERMAGGARRAAESVAGGVARTLAGLRVAGIPERGTL